MFYIVWLNKCKMFFQLLACSDLRWAVNKCIIFRGLYVILLCVCVCMCVWVCVCACVCVGVHVYLRVCMLVCMSETDKPMQTKITGEEEIVMFQTCLCYVCRPWRYKRFCDVCADLDNTSMSVMCVQTLMILVCPHCVCRPWYKWVCCVHRPWWYKSVCCMCRP